VHGTYQMPFAALEELARRPVQRPPCMRTDVQPCPYLIAIAVQHQRFRIPINNRRHCMKPLVRQGIETGKFNFWSDRV